MGFEQRDNGVWFTFEKHPCGLQGAGVRKGRADTTLLHHAGSMWWWPEWCVMVRNGHRAGFRGRAGRIFWCMLCVLGVRVGMLRGSPHLTLMRVSDQGWLQSLGLNTWRAQHLWDMEVCSRTGELTWLYLNLSIFLCYTKWGSYQTWGAAV